MRSNLTVAFVLIVIAGCSDSDRLPTYAAGGIVHFPDGKPLSGGSILCESPQGLGARAIINEDGTFVLGTYEQADGAVEGRHLVAIRPPSTFDVDPDNGMGRQPSPAIDERFLSMDTSGIVFDVKADGDNHFEIEVSAPKSRR
jgi:hypothetical protein